MALIFVADRDLSETEKAHARQWCTDTWCSVCGATDVPLRDSQCRAGEVWYKARTCVGEHNGSHGPQPDRNSTVHSNAESSAIRQR